MKISIVRFEYDATYLWEMDVVVPDGFSVKEIRRIESDSPLQMSILVTDGEIERMVHPKLISRSEITIVAQG